MPINPTYFRADSTIAAQDRFDQHAEDKRDGRNDFPANVNFRITA